MSAASIAYLLLFVLYGLCSAGQAKPSSSVLPYQTDEVAAMVPEMSHKLVPPAGGYEPIMPNNVADPIRALQNLMLLYGNDKNWKKLNGFYTLLSSQQKRQIRYQQCYFNPISCFRR